MAMTRLDVTLGIEFICNKKVHVLPHLLKLRSYACSKMSFEVPEM